MVNGKNIRRCFACLLSGVLIFNGSAVYAQERLYQNEFPLNDVTLLDGPFKKARDLNIKTLLE